MNSPITTAAQVHPLISERYSPVWFDEKTPDTETLRGIFEAARLAASSRNEQPWRFLFASRASHPETYAQLLDSLSPANQIWAASAPVLIATYAKTHVDADQSVNGYARHDVGLAIGNLSVQALASGILLHQMGGFSRTKLLAAFPIPEGFEPVSVLALGYPGDLAAAPEEVRSRAQRPRSRKPLSEVVFEGRFGQAAFEG